MQEPEIENTSTNTVNWKAVWVIAIIGAALFSAPMGYSAPIVFAVLYPTAQLIGIAFIPNARYSVIWLLHIFYWIGLLFSGASEIGFAIGLLGSSFIGEFMLQLIFKDLVKWRWLLFNTVAMLILIASYLLALPFDGSVLLNPVLIVMICLSASAFVSAQGIEKE